MRVGVVRVLARTAGHVLATATIRQRLRNEHGLNVSVASLRRCVRANPSEGIRRRQVAVLRGPAVPGEEARTDCGQAGPGTGPTTGGKPRVRPVLLMGRRSWSEATRRHSPASAASRAARGRAPGLYGPRINRSCGGLARHYGTPVGPAGPRKPAPASSQDAGARASRHCGKGSPTAPHTSRTDRTSRPPAAPNPATSTPDEPENRSSSNYRTVHHRALGLSSGPDARLRRGCVQTRSRCRVLPRAHPLRNTLRRSSPTRARAWGSVTPRPGRGAMHRTPTLPMCWLVCTLLAAVPTSASG